LLSKENVKKKKALAERKGQRSYRHVCICTSLTHCLSSSMDLLLASVNMTTTAASSLDDDHTSVSIGYIYVVVAVLFFGSNYVPAAQYPIGDSLSFQFFLCCGIWITGVVIDLIVKSPTFFPLIMIGGVLWTTGNILSVYAVRINGLGVSMLLWCTTS